MTVDPLALLRSLDLVTRTGRLRPTRIVAWRGPSAIDGTPVMLVLTGLRRPSTNSKTGPMVQSWILREDMHPLEAVKTGADSSICGSCPLRPWLAEHRRRTFLSPAT